METPEVHIMQQQNQDGDRSDHLEQNAPAGLVGPDPTRSIEVWAYNEFVDAEPVARALREHVAAMIADPGARSALGDEFDEALMSSAGLTASDLPGGRLEATERWPLHRDASQLQLHTANITTASEEVIDKGIKVIDLLTTVVR